MRSELIDVDALLAKPAQPGGFSNRRGVQQGRGLPGARVGKHAKTITTGALATFWEVAMLASRGRVALDREPLSWARDLLAGGKVEAAALTPSAAMSAAGLVDFPGDPADRFIYATARELGVPLASKDRLLRDYSVNHNDVRVLW